MTARTAKRVPHVFGEAVARREQNGATAQGRGAVKAVGELALGRDTEGGALPDLWRGDRHEMSVRSYLLRRKEQC